MRHPLNRVLNRSVLISGCSGGGKSTLVAELAARGHRIIAEPGRRVIAQEQRQGGNALPWIDMLSFVEKTRAMARDDLVTAEAQAEWVFFDRGLIDAAAAYAHLTGRPIDPELAHQRPYNDTVFLAPPWPEIYQTDAARRHDLNEAIAEYDRLCPILADLGYTVIDLPKTPVPERADFVLSHLGEDRQQP